MATSPEEELLSYFLPFQSKINNFFSINKPLLLEPLQALGIPVSEVEDIPSISYESNDDNLPLVFGVLNPEDPQFLLEDEITIFGNIPKRIVIHPYTFIEYFATKASDLEKLESRTVNTILVLTAISFGIDSLASTLTTEKDKTNWNDVVFEFMKAANVPLTPDILDILESEY